MAECDRPAALGRKSRASFKVKPASLACIGPHDAKLCLESAGAAGAERLFQHPPHPILILGVGEGANRLEAGRTLRGEAGHRAKFTGPPGALMLEVLVIDAQARCLEHEEEILFACA